MEYFWELQYVDNFQIYVFYVHMNHNNSILLELLFCSYYVPPAFTIPSEKRNIFM